MYEVAFKNIDDTLWKDAGCSSELDYIEQTSWILFLKYLDDFEAEKQKAAEINSKTYKRIIDGEYCWVQWAAPKKDGKLDYNIAMTGSSAHVANTPNEETLAAIAEAESGDVKRFKTLEEFMADLDNADD